MRVTLVICAAVLALGACSRPAPSQTKNVSITIPGANGASTVIGNQTPQNLPSFVQVYPGAKVTASMVSPNGGVLVMETAAPPDQVMNFYKQLATSQGFVAGLDSWSMGQQQTGAHVVMFSVPGTQKSLTASVEAKTGETTKVGLTYGT
jgi:hypothetical protein